MASTLHLIPTKGMTLPFLSYGGSSMLALALGMGMMLALTAARASAGRRAVSRAPRRPRGRRHRRASVSGRGAGRASWSTRRVGASRRPTGAADAFAAAVPGVAIIAVRAGRLGGGRSARALGLAELALGLVQARRLLRRLDPRRVVGFGGYPSVPTMLAATQLGLPTVIHEQNAVLGRANRLLARRVQRDRHRLCRDRRPAAAPTAHAPCYTGNPVRPAIARRAPMRPTGRRKRSGRSSC